jgi:hypothetical protein
MKRITTDNGRISAPSYIPLPWHVVAEFCRMIAAGCVVTFGPYPRRKTYEGQEEDQTFPHKRFFQSQAGKALKGGEVYG